MNCALNKINFPHSHLFPGPDNILLELTLFSKYILVLFFRYLIFIQSSLLDAMSLLTQNGFIISVRNIKKREIISSNNIYLIDT